MPRANYRATKRTAENDASFSGDPSESIGDPIEITADSGPDTIAGFPVANPADADGGPADSGNAPKRRGRKPGTKNAPKEKASNLAGLESLLLSVHVMGSTLLKIPELAIDQKEAKLLADAIQGVAEHYPMVIDPKYAAIANLVMVGIGIYGTRVFAYSNRIKREKSRNLEAVAEPTPIDSFFNFAPASQG